MTTPIGNKRYLFDIYCKGGKKDIEEFFYRTERMKANEKWGRWSGHTDGESRDLYDDYTYSETYGRSEDMFFCPVEASCAVASSGYVEPFLSIIKDFTAETGKPLSIFFNLKQSCDGDNVGWGYTVYENGVEKTRLASALRIADYKEEGACKAAEYKTRMEGMGYTEEEYYKPGDDDEKSIAFYTEKCCEAAAQERHNEEILPLLYNWIYDFSNPVNCLAAIKENPETVKAIPEAQLTEKLCLTVIEMYQRDGEFSWKDARRCFKTKKACLAAISKDGSSLQYAPEKFKTVELCRMAVERFGLALRFTPAQFINEELVRIAVARTGRALEFVDEHYKTAELCGLAVEQDPCALAFVPDALKTQEMCHAAMKKSNYFAAWAFKYIPDRFKTAELCRKMVAKNGSLISEVPEELKTAELCRMAVEKDGSTIIYVPDALLTPELCLAAVQESGMAIRKIPPALRTAEICHAAVTSAGTSAVLP